MDTTQEELIAALVRRLDGRKPHIARRLRDGEVERPDRDLIIDLEYDGMDEDVLDLR